MSAERIKRTSAILLLTALLAACSSTSPFRVGKGQVVCDSYLILDMCVRDVVGDGTVDMIYFTDTEEIFMYQAGRKELVAKEMDFHQCAVPLNEGMQDTTNRILQRENLSLTQELAITKDLISNYMAAKPTIDACNANFEKQNTDAEPAEDEFFMDDAEWNTGWDEEA